MDAIDTILIIAAFAAVVGLVVLALSMVAVWIIEGISKVQQGRKKASGQ